MRAMPDDPTPQPPPLPPQPPQQQTPRPVIPIEEPAGEASAGEPVIPVAEPGVVAPAPFAQVYSAPPPPPGYYPPAYPPPLESTGQAQGATAYPPPAQYPPPAAYPPPPAPYPPAGGYSAAQAPWPTAPVDYRGAGYGGQYSRPAFVTTLAVFSIVTAALSLLASAFTGCTSAVVLSGAQRGSVVMSGPPATRTPATVAPPPPVATPSPNGRGPGDVGVVSNVQRSKTARAMSPERRRQLEAFLGEQGKLVFDSPDGIITSRKVFDTLGSVGQEFARAGQTGADYFQIKESPICKLPGRLRVFDDRAVFEPDDHSATLRSAAPKPSQEEVTEPVPVDPGLTDEGATAVINQVRTYSRNLLNDAQTNTLRSTLQSPAYSAWVAPSSTVPGLTAQVKSVVVRPDKSVTIQFVTTAVTLDAQGNVVGGPPAVPGGGANPATMPAGSGGTVTLGAISVSKGSCGTALAEAAISALLAIFLLVVAILSLRQSPGVGRLYLIYAIAKLICGVLGVVAFARIINSLSAGTDTSGYAQTMVTAFGGMARFALGVTLIGLVLPVVILLTFTLNRAVKAYFRTA
jgi:hypothetical protein